MSVCLRRNEEVNKTKEKICVIILFWQAMISINNFPPSLFRCDKLTRFCMSAISTAVFAQPFRDQGICVYAVTVATLYTPCCLSLPLSPFFFFCLVPLIGKLAPVINANELPAAISLAFVTIRRLHVYKQREKAHRIFLLQHFWITWPKAAIAKTRLRPLYLLIKCWCLNNI